jgi:2-aminoethylphosphonate-pyruvate transaminase
MPIDLATLPAAAILASSNKCLEGTPGIAFALVDRGVLAPCAGRSASMSLDLHAQWQGFEANGQWRFTPPVQVVAALVEALRRLEAEGGSAARLARYTANCATLTTAAKALRLELYLDAALQAPIIVTFRSPPRFAFGTFYDALAAAGFVIYPGKLTQGESFRIGCIGAVTPADFTRLAAALGPALASATQA